MLYILVVICKKCSLYYDKLLCVSHFYTEHVIYYTNSVALMILKSPVISMTKILWDTNA